MRQRVMDAFSSRSRPAAREIEPDGILKTSFQSAAMFNLPALLLQSRAAIHRSPSLPALSA